MPLAATVGTLAESDLDDTLGLAPRPPREAEWTPPVSDPYARPAVEERAVDELAAMAAPATGNITSRDVRESDVSPDPEYATVAHEPVAREAAVLPSLLETPEPVRALADKAEMAEEESERHEPALPPTPFEDSPLSALPATGSLPDVTQRMSGEDITDMFAEPYTALAPSLPPALPIPPEAPPRVAPVPPRRSARKTPPLGTGRAGGRSQAAPRMGRRATPVLSQAITPMSAPMIRRTPMAPSDAVERAPVAPPTALTAMPLSPTPIAVPVQQDIVASRAVAQALETVAARIRAGQIVVAGQVPMGDDVTALAAAVAAALAALLGVQS